MMCFHASYADNCLRTNVSHKGHNSNERDGNGFHREGKDAKSSNQDVFRWKELLGV